MIKIPTDIQKLHNPVLTKEVSELLRLGKFAHLSPKAKAIDATLGMGGHTEILIQMGLSVMGIDADSESIEIAKARLEKTCPALNSDIKSPDFIPVLGNFSSIDELAKGKNFYPVDIVLLDLGISSYQLDNRNYGMSFLSPDSELDMRIDKRKSVLAKDLLNALNVGALTDLFDTVLQNKKEAKEIAVRAVAQRKTKPFSLVSDLLEVLEGLPRRSFKVDSATLPFLALRIAVNSELENLEKALPRAFSLLKPGGRMAVISFHSLEDLLVKKFIRSAVDDNSGLAITDKPVMASDSELLVNKRSRSSKLRVIEKL